ncbi:hypothetical protein MAPG_09393 [Magnaporthiopsis poae ATCC 64411]|uniref:CCHC-type domain-containing protein n=1 Tax=Magnaporthiopsis poae (strain ATCC 64411 / 73-15) TaxID=644358 RepID=A0A0C4E9U3_MAGP6|nr:hypothetical protein MAPG_09393 [Magnaporthiopsis poae ATCC 64411]
MAPPPKNPDQRRFERALEWMSLREEGGPPPRACQVCGDKGHWHEDCDLRATMRRYAIKQKSSRGNLRSAAAAVDHAAVNNNNTAVAAVDSSSKPTEPSPMWSPETPSRHMIFSPSDFLNLTPPYVPLSPGYTLQSPDRLFGSAESGGSQQGGGEGGGDKDAGKDATSEPATGGDKPRRRSIFPWS